VTDPRSEPSGANRQAQADVAPAAVQHLWAPWRYGYIAGDDNGIDGCPFCVLPQRGEEHDRESLILHRAEHAFVIFNAYPYNPGHLMVVPFAHVGQLADLDPETSAEVWELGRRCVAMLRERTFCEGINLGMNLGKAGGAGISDHLHLHVVPRWSADTNFISTVGATRVLPVALEELYEHLSGAL